ncbi:HlyD family efflux transporter periplasmic adaptor subunit (plasmid) [Skermanella sp. TT6]|uniref:HlyD family efflux transporter periplasmic adaptor subunit n=1 Tax=Skermanella cutis TaxID=2775420 RepID=A0ABX7BES2_9PROT|nr:HlyD family efflux transporter periplasmic adaptor subunit [Skermanella sp. TT6]QQP92697.1 HlyD family efflux transporter periplasmic adaptor subunit [Skermanella sp. TT6]
MTIRTRLLTAVGVTAGLLLAGFTLSGRQEAPQVRPAVADRIVPVARGLVDVDGGLVQIAAERDGVVRAVLAEEGETVRQGQPLAAMDDRAAGIQIGIAEAQLAERQAAVEAQAVQVDRARRERDRLATLARTDAASRKSLDEAETEARLAAAELALRRAEKATAEANVRSARYEREVRTITAPADGAIVRRLVRPGDGVSTLNVTPLFWFAPGTAAIVRAEADETVAPLLRVGQAAEIALETSQSETIARGRVLRIGKAYGPRRVTTYEPRDRADMRVLEVTVGFDGEPPQVPLGQRVLVRFLPDPPA